MDRLMDGWMDGWKWWMEVMINGIIRISFTTHLHLHLSYLSNLNGTDNSHLDCYSQKLSLFDGMHRRDGLSRILSKTDIAHGTTTAPCTFQISQNISKSLIIGSRFHFTFPWTICSNPTNAVIWSNFKAMRKEFSESIGRPIGSCCGRNRRTSTIVYR